MVVIRLSKAGSVHRPFYHVVVTDSRARRDSRYIERIGFLNYFATESEKLFELDETRLNYWVERGAILRPSINKLVKRKKREDLLIVEGKEIKRKVKKIQAPKLVAKAQAEAPAVEASTEPTETSTDDKVAAVQAPEKAEAEQTESAAKADEQKSEQSLAS